MENGAIHGYRDASLRCYTAILVEMIEHDVGTILLRGCDALMSVVSAPPPLPTSPIRPHTQVC